MKVLFVSDYGKDSVVDITETDESSVYRAIAKELVNFEPKCTVNVSCSLGEAAYTVQLRSGTILVNEIKNTFHFTGIPQYPHVYLTCIETGYNEVTGRDKNHYKFYELEQKGNEVIATYGRIGSMPGEKYGERTCTYQLSMFWIKYEEKIAKGYKDQSTIYLSEEYSVPETKDEDKKQKKNTIATRLFNQLKTFCKTHIEKSCRSTKVTEGMVSESKKLLEKLYESKGVEEFNNTLLQLMSISPRRVSQVCELLASDEKDFPSIILREENLVNAMEGLKSTVVSSDEQPFDGVTIKRTTCKDQEVINKLLAPELKGKVTGTWKIESDKFESRYQKYLKEHKITVTKLLWHGSRNENWLSIINNGFLLNPNAVITGKMFGNGIYFAPSCMKSWGYTSSYGSYWARGNSNVAFMGIYETAYGTPKKVQYAHSYNQAGLLREGKNCVHAERGVQLRNDEIVYYSESAMVLRYLVRFEV